jgi:hypothetical protein
VEIGLLEYQFPAVLLKYLLIAGATVAGVIPASRQYEERSHIRRDWVPLLEMQGTQHIARFQSFVIGPLLLMCSMLAM